MRRLLDGSGGLGRATAVGFASTFVGIGLERFAYTPLIPALVASQWFSASEATYLGAANLLGYLVGALSAGKLSAMLGSRRGLGLAFGLAAASFFCCAVSTPFAWFFLWRLISGLTGGWLMVIGPSVAMRLAEPAKRTAAATRTFMGIGAGALASAVIVPALIDVGLTASWSVLGIVCLMAGVTGVVALSSDESPPPETVAEPSSAVSSATGLAVALTTVAYVGEAVGFVPHTVFWVDYLEREAGLSTAAANLQWALFGLGAMFGPLLVGGGVRHAGWRRGLALALALQGLAVALSFVSVAWVARSCSSFVVGAFVPGVVALTSGRIAELVGMDAYARHWGRATALFALGQAVAGYGMAGFYAVVGSGRPLFLFAGTLLVLSAVSACAGGRSAMPGRRQA